MNLTKKLTQKNIFKRVLWAYGIHLMLELLSFAAGYMFLPEGVFRKSIITKLSETAAQQQNFSSEFITTIAFNIIIAFLLGVVLNLQRVNGFPTGYIFIFFAGIGSGLIAGTNSFVEQIVSPYTLEGWLVSLKIGHLEFLGYTCITASTIGVGLQDYTSWFPWKAKSLKIKSLREITLSNNEIICLIIGIILVIIAGYNETELIFQTF